jgi:hypothetical protein
MADRIYLVAAENFFHLAGRADVRLQKNVSAGVKLSDIAQVMRIPGIGKLINIDNPALKIRLIEEIADKIAANETAAACD